MITSSRDEVTIDYHNTQIRISPAVIMETASEIVSLSNQLAQAVEAALNPEVPQDKRHEAYNACEEFKEKSPLGIQCSVYLSLHGSHLVRHFGLQLMEYCVKYKWYEIDQPQKISIKDVTMSLLQSCEGDMAHHIHLRDALSRVIVEMMKREWPQHWPNLLPELYQIAAEGHIQAEIVLLTFLRFIEDIVVLQTLEYAQRRKDLYQHLTLQLEEIFTFLVSLMALHYPMNVPESVRVVNLSLKLLSEIIEFASINRLVAEETRLLPALCSFLSNEHFHLETAECLNRIATKKGKQEDKRTICKLLLKSPLVNNMSHLDMMSQNGTLNEYNYVFVKRVSELLASICSLLCTVVKNENDNLHDYVDPEHFIVFLEMLINLCNHPSLVVQFHVNTCWTSLFRHTILNKNANILNYVTKWVSHVTPKLMKMSYNPERGIPMFQECYKYLPFDFDSEEAFATFYHRFRFEQLEAFRHLSGIAPLVVFSYLEQWLVTRIQKTSLTSKSLCSPYSEEYAEWEAISVIGEVIISNLPKSHGIVLERSLRLLDLCFTLKPADPGITSFLLSCVSPLMYFVSTAPPEVANVYVPRLLELVFSSLVFEIPGETHFARSKSVRSLRRHAPCLLVKLSRMYPNLFLPFFGHIRNVFSEVKRNPAQLNKTESVIFFESMLQINNGFSDFERQSVFVKEVFDEVKDYWMKLTADVFGDPAKFASFIGLDVKPTSRDAFFKNCTELMYCVEVISAIIKRSGWPESKEAAVNGGFVIGVNGDRPVYRNPATVHVLPALPGIFSLIKVMHCLWTDEARNKLPAEYENVHEMSKLELKSLSGGHIQQKEFHSFELPANAAPMVKMQNFLLTLYETCFVVLKKACLNFGDSFYELPNFAPSFVASVFFNMDAIPDYRLRAMVKVFMRSFIYSCPSDKYDSLLVPVLGFFSTYMSERLTNKWKYWKECRENGKLNDEDGAEDNKELVEHLMNTQLSREYMDVVKSMLLKMSNSDVKQCNGSNEETPSPVGSQNNLHLAVNVYDNLSDLGVKLLRYESSRYGITSFVLSAISLSDSSNSLKATFKIPTIIKQLIADGNLSPELAVQTIIHLLQGLQLHGQHDANQGSLLNSAVQCYQALRPLYPQVLEIMTMVPGINMDDLQKFDQKVLQLNASTKVDKGMREMFRKLVNNLIGRNIGQLFKRKELIRDLPKIEIPRPKGEDILNISGNENDIGITNFFR